MFGVSAAGTTFAGTLQASKKIINEGGEEAKTKLKTARYFNSNILPEIDSIISIIKKGKSNMMDFGTEEL